ncbi:disulfide bond formation protein DsbB [Pseudoalteromonas rubra]|uniref:Disulfide bond formation protein B n=1 Tax=Pseudoalteromonas rubra TaxID=43658 RepID=A0A5S3WJ94_9GAMM|nr:disulfide bond formation protein DsbB [Pseudoalteromonas rubra]TMP27361.1 disulfide bond formation protein DsbB [Pseudoalteromonas rubra]TMP36899.1 disulfide bond formation protein DsbB [Pseudoalteromonas rubra]
MLNKLADFSRTRLAWGALFFSAFVLEVIALYFQYAMGLEPCIMCIYQRTAVLGIVAAGLIGLTSPTSLPVRLLAMSCWGVSAIWGWLLAKEHIAMQTTTDPFAFTCDFVPNFPSFMPLHEWLPAFFAATGDCGNIDWFFAGLSMPGWMEVIFALYSISFIAFAAVFVVKR